MPHDTEPSVHGVSRIPPGVTAVVMIPNYGHVASFKSRLITSSTGDFVTPGQILRGETVGKSKYTPILVALIPSSWRTHTVFQDNADIEWYIRIVEAMINGQLDEKLELSAKTYGFLDVMRLFANRVRVLTCPCIPQCAACKALQPESTRFCDQVRSRFVRR